MKWSLQQLYRYREFPLEFSGTTSYDEYATGVYEILRMDQVSYSGQARFLGNDKYQFILVIKTTLYLEDSRTLEEIPFPIDLKVTEDFGKNPDEDERYIDMNTIDLYDVIWENILLEIPMRIVKTE